MKTSRRETRDVGQVPQGAVHCHLSRHFPLDVKLARLPLPLRDISDASNGSLSSHGNLANDKLAHAQNGQFTRTGMRRVQSADSNGSNSSAARLNSCLIRASHDAAPLSLKAASSSCSHHTTNDDPDALSDAHTGPASYSNSASTHEADGSALSNGLQTNRGVAKQGAEGDRAPPHAATEEAPRGAATVTASRSAGHLGAMVLASGHGASSHNVSSRSDNTGGVHAPARQRTGNDLDPAGKAGASDSNSSNTSWDASTAAVTEALRKLAEGMLARGLRQRPHPLEPPPPACPVPITAVLKIQRAVSTSPRSLQRLQELAAAETDAQPHQAEPKPANTSPEAKATAAAISGRAGRSQLGDHPSSDCKTCAGAHKQVAEQSHPSGNAARGQSAGATAGNRRTFAPSSGASAKQDDVSQPREGSASGGPSRAGSSSRNVTSRSAQRASQVASRPAEQQRGTAAPAEPTLQSQSSTASKLTRVRCGVAAGAFTENAAISPSASLSSSSHTNAAAAGNPVDVARSGPSRSSFSSLPAESPNASASRSGSRSDLHALSSQPGVERREALRAMRGDSRERGGELPPAGGGAPHAADAPVVDAMLMEMITGRPISAGYWRREAALPQRPSQAQDSARGAAPRGPGDAARDDDSSEQGRAMSEYKADVGSKAMAGGGGGGGRGGGERSNGGRGGGSQESSHAWLQEHRSSPTPGVKGTRDSKASKDSPTPDSPSPQSVHVNVPCAWEPPLRGPPRAPTSTPCGPAVAAGAAAATAPQLPAPAAQASTGGVVLTDARVDEHVDQPAPPTPSDANSAVNGPTHTEFEYEQEVDQPDHSEPASTAPTALSSAGSPSQQGSPYAAAAGSPYLPHPTPASGSRPPPTGTHTPPPRSAALVSQPRAGAPSTARARSTASRRPPLAERGTLPRPRARVTKPRVALHARARLPHSPGPGHVPQLMNGAAGAAGALGVTGPGGVILPAMPQAAAAPTLTPGAPPLEMAPLMDVPLAGLHSSAQMGNMYRRSTLEGFPGTAVFSQAFPAAPPQHLLQPNPFQQMQHWPLEQQQMLPYQVPLMVPGHYMRPPHLGPAPDRVSHFSVFNPQQAPPAHAPCLPTPWPYAPQPSYMPIYPVSASTRMAYGASPNSAGIPTAMWNGNPLAVGVQGAPGNMNHILQAQQLWRRAHAAQEQGQELQPTHATATRHGSQSAADTNLGGSMRRSSMHRG